MKFTFGKGACATSIMMIALAAAIVPLHAVDNNNRYFAYGVGQRGCEDYISFRERRLDALEKQHERYTKDELYEIVDRIVNMNELKSLLEKSCRSNSKRRFAEAMVSVFQGLNPKRVKAEGGK